MHIFGLLCITHVYAKPECMPMKHTKCVGKTCVLMQNKMHECSSCKPKCTSEVLANQRCKHAVRANHDAHGSRLTSHVYTCALNVHFYVIDFPCTTGYVASIFRNVSSRIVVSRVYSQI